MTFRVEKNVMIPMRDGIRLATDLWIPDHPTSFPTLLVRLPYSKDAYPAAEIDYPTNPNIFRLLMEGYAIVYQDCRGTGESEGIFDPLMNEADDGVDTVEWIGRQKWCSGSIGTFGHSYLGFTQWATASRAPEGLKAIAPAVSAPDFYAAPFYSAGGALSWHAVWFWANIISLTPTNNANRSDLQPLAIMNEAIAMLENAQEHLKMNPPIEQDLYQNLFSWWESMLMHPERDSYWTDSAPSEHLDSVSVPALSIGGWFDLFAGETVKAYTHMRSEGATRAAREGQRLIMGPWDHAYLLGDYHDRQFGPTSSVYSADLTQAHLDFFDEHLRAPSNMPSTAAAPVRIFVMGVNQWRDEQDWPLPDTTYVDHHLSGGAAPENEGRLNVSPTVTAGAAQYVYDPSNPVPTTGGRLMMPASRNQVGPVDRRMLGKRDDVLVYSTPPLVDPVEVTGFVTAILFVSSSAVDTDFTVKLLDVDPSGRATYLTDGIVRMRYRNSLTEPTLLEPETVYEVTVDLAVTSNVFLPGHRIRAEISSSDFPRYDRNPNTGSEIATSSSWITATNRVHYGPDYPSRLVLPVIDRTTNTETV
ncbi:CocE/NonD family hydrolase [Rhodococcus erythropolis]|uniref:CocE/NonD family hydrolase n=1 Tax=Rhodococcus erythropolis TaxID=1833 RepID=UPI001BE6CD3D|nr:CocE/NonD family hydrolase [Rhodococcus erythropolis]MBT2266078.1 CocE/NonD family hydrolase [Rhodococcus erythropolis]